MTVLLIVSLGGQDTKIERQRDGRRVALEVVCGIEQASIDAGRQQLLRFGLDDAAADYARTIARAVERESGVRGIVTPDGQLRCDLLLRASGATP